MTRDLDLLKVDVDIIGIVIRFRGASRRPAGAVASSLENSAQRHLAAYYDTSSRPAILS